MSMVNVAEQALVMRFYLQRPVVPRLQPLLEIASLWLLFTSLKSTDYIMNI